MPPMIVRINTLFPWTELTIQSS